MAFEILVKAQADVQDTINLIISTIKNYSNSEFVKSLTNKLIAKGGSKIDFLKNLFIYACNNVDYKLDPLGHEKVTTPERLIRDGFGDCKKFTVLIGATLKNAGIPFALKVVSYDGYNWAHIYVIVPTSDGHYITLDPVNDCRYNKEVRFKKAKLFYLNGKTVELPGNTSLGHCNNSISCIDELDNDILGITDEFELNKELILSDVLLDESLGKKTKEERKARRAKILGFLAKFPLGRMRKNALGVIANNQKGIADVIYVGMKRDKEKVLQGWRKFGGKDKEFIEAVEFGSKKSLAAGPVVKFFQELFSPADTPEKRKKWGNYAQLGFPIVLAIIAILKKMKIFKPEEEQEVDKEIEKFEDETFDTASTQQAALSFFTLSGMIFKYILLKSVVPVFNTIISDILFISVITILTVTKYATQFKFARA